MIQCTNVAWSDLDFLRRYNHNFLRLFAWEQSSGVPWSSEKVWFTPLPYQRTGPGKSLDGEPRFNLLQWNPQYFQRLYARVRAAGDRGIYVSIMLFNGWSVDAKRSTITTTLPKNSLGDPWCGHPFHPHNNINDIDGGEGGKVHTLQNPAVTELQKAYIRKVIDTVGNLNNVLWEISNESNPESTLWEYEMIRFIHQYEATRPQQHPVGMTAEFPGGSNAALWQSPADWIAPGPGPERVYMQNPPSATGGKVVITDTDHLWGIGGSPDWVWKSFTRGLNPIFMDPYEAELVDLYPMYRSQPSVYPTQTARGRVWDAIRNNLGYTHAYTVRINLAAMMPHGELASSGYCLANPGSEYLVYVPTKRGWRILRKLPSRLFAEHVEVELSRAKGALQFEWFDPTTGTTVAGGTMAGGDKHAFAAPVRGGGLVLYIHTR